METEELKMSASVNTALAASPRHIMSHWRLRRDRKLKMLRSRSHSMGSIPLTNMADSLDNPENQPDRDIKRSTQSLTEFLGEEVNEDIFQEEVVRKTQTHMVGWQEAEAEVVLDRLIAREGSREKALLFVVAQMATELKVQIFVNTLLNRGAHPSFRDNEWQTPLHHAVRRGFKGVVSKLLEHEAMPHARDNNRKLPLHLALESGHDEIASMLLKYMPNHVVRDLFITHRKDEAECTLHYLLEKQMQLSALAVLDCMVDRIGQTEHVQVYFHVLEADEKGRPPTHPQFQPNSKSCLHLISNKGYKEIVYHLVVRLLIRRKWKAFARWRFQMNSFLFLATLACLSFSVVVSVVTPDPAVYDSPVHIVRAVVEVWSVLSAASTFIIELNQIRNHRLEYLRDQFNLLDLSSSTLLLSLIPLRFCHRKEQWPVFALGFVLWTLRLFKYSAVFRQTGAYAQILWRVISRDFLQFTVVFLVILLAFSGSFVMALRWEDSLDLHRETSTFWAVLFTGVRTLIEGQPVVEYAGEQGYKPLSCFIMVVFLFFCCVVLLNILIAQLSDTYQNVQRDAQCCLELNRAWIIARVELNSIFNSKSYRVSKYLEMEELANPTSALEKWESPLLNEVSKQVRDIREGLESTEMNMLTIKNRLSRQEYALQRIQVQLDQLLEIHKTDAKTKKKLT